MVHYIDTFKPMTIQVIASKQGLGAPSFRRVQTSIVLSVKSSYLLSSAMLILSTNYSPVFSADRFHIHLFRHKFTMESEHMLLVQIQHKNLADMAVHPPHM